MNAVKYVYTQETFIQMATQINCAGDPPVVRNTVMPIAPRFVTYGQLDGMAECVDLRVATRGVLWLNFIWEEYYGL